MEDRKRKRNLMVDLSKFTSNKMINFIAKLYPLSNSKF